MCIQFYSLLRVPFIYLITMCVNVYLLLLFFRDPDKKNKVSIYNCSNNGINVLEGPEINDLKLKLFNDYPFNKVLWAPNLTYCKYEIVYLIRFLFFQMFPAMMVDQVLRIIKVNFR